ncbi:MAG: DUF4893 domain-containing protein [Pseudomonadota bacterium]
MSRADGGGRRRTLSLVLTAALICGAPAYVAGAEQSLCGINKVDWLAEHQHKMLSEFEQRAVPFETYARRQDDRVVAQAFDNLAGKRKLIAFDARHPARGTVSGNYQCRKIQLDSGFGYAYPFFRCRIEDDGEGSFELVKLSGSQRFTGLLHRITTSDTSDGPTGHLIYQGMFHAGDDAPKPWDAFSRDSQVGCMTARADGSLVLEMPPQNGFQSHVLWEFRKR